MHVWNGLAEVPSDLGRSVVTLGNFDGVHRGHRAVLGQLVEQASAREATSVAVTFDPHPLAVLFPERAPTPLTSLPQRLSLLAGTGLDAVLVMEFTTDFARLTPEEFVEQVFVDALHAGAVIVGEDTRFGWRNSGRLSFRPRLARVLVCRLVSSPLAGTGKARYCSWKATRHAL